MTPEQARSLIDEVMSSDRPHVEKMTLAAASLSEMLRDRGMEATLVGGGAIEFYAPGVYTTSDLDLIVEGRSREELDSALREAGFSRRGRHWVRGELFVEVPGSVMADPVETIEAAGMRLRVARREVVLADRIVGFKHWRVTGYGAQAVALLAVLGDVIDDDLLRERVRREQAEDALDLLRRLAAEGGPIDDDRLRLAIESLHAVKGRPE